MIKYKQIPFIRLAAGNALERGEIDLPKYNEVVQYLDQLEQLHKISEERAQRKLIRNLNRAFSYGA
jgi:hypothetical protein